MLDCRQKNNSCSLDSSKLSADDGILHWRIIAGTFEELQKLFIFIKNTYKLWEEFRAYFAHEKNKNLNGFHRVENKLNVDFSKVYVFLRRLQNFDEISQLIWKLFSKASNQLGAFIKFVVSLENLNCSIHVSTISNHGLGMTLFTTKIEPICFIFILTWSQYMTTTRCVAVRKVVFCRCHLFIFLNFEKISSNTTHYAPLTDIWDPYLIICDMLIRSNHESWIPYLWTFIVCMFFPSW